VSWFPPRPDAPSPDAGASVRPRWRSSSFGWLLLHLAIGVALAVGLILLELGAIASSGHDLLRVQNVPRTDTAMLRASAVVVVTAAIGGFGGWILFVYLRASARVRGLTLATCLGGAFAIALAFLVPLLPSIP
jgi:hypothetical protein